MYVFMLCIMFKFICVCVCVLQFHAKSLPRFSPHHFIKTRSLTLTQLAMKFPYLCLPSPELQMDSRASGLCFFFL